MLEVNCSEYKEVQFIKQIFKPLNIDVKISYS